jgi:hypothetical protein
MTNRTHEEDRSFESHGPTMAHRSGPVGSRQPGSEPQRGVSRGYRCPEGGLDLAETLAGGQIVGGVILNG